MPNWLTDAFSKAKRDDREDLLVTVVCTELCSQLIDEGVDKLHFYTLNRPDLTRDICHALGITTAVKLEKNCLIKQLLCPFKSGQCGPGFRFGVRFGPARYPSHDSVAKYVRLRPKMYKIT